MDDQDAPAPSPSSQPDVATSTPADSSSSTSAPADSSPQGSAQTSGAHERLRGRGLKASDIPVAESDARHLADALDAQDASEHSANPPKLEVIQQKPGDGMKPDENHPDPNLPSEPGLTQEERASRGVGRAGEGEPTRPVDDSTPGQ